MKEFLQYIKQYKSKCITVFFVFFFVIIGIPLVINYLYKTTTTIDFFVTEWNASDTLSYYGAILTFVGTTILSVLALWQNHAIKMENDKHTHLLEKMEREKIYPFIVIKEVGCDGNFANIHFNLENVSDNIAGDIIITNIRIETQEGETIWDTKESYEYEYLKQNECQTITLKNNPFDPNKENIVFTLKYTDILAWEHTYTFKSLFKNNKKKFEKIKVK